MIGFPSAMKQYISERVVHLFTLIFEVTKTNIMAIPSETNALPRGSTKKIIPTPDQLA